MENKMITGTLRQDIELTPSILNVIGEALLYEVVPASYVRDAMPHPQAIKDAERAVDALTDRIGNDDLRTDIENAVSLCLAAYEEHSFQRGMRIGARIVLELLGKMPS
jgi:hypothetical protein